MTICEGNKMAICEGNKIGGEIVKILGIKNCIGIDIHIALNEFVTVKAEFYPEIDGVKQILPIIEKYELVRKEPKTDSINEEWKSL